MPQFFYDCLSFAVAHIFFWPLPIAALEAAAIHYTWGTSNLLLVVIVLAILNILYGLTYLGRPEHHGNRFKAPFTEPWVGCHPYFPVRTLMWDGKTYTSEPNKGHEEVFNVQDRTFVFGMHPHGAVPLGAAVFRPQISRWKKLNEYLRVGVASPCFWLPFMRDFYLWFGSIDASKRTLLHNIKQGRSVVLLPGGIREQLWVCKPNEDVSVIKDRKGFVKLALETGSALVPVFIFNERNAYKTNKLATTLFSPLLKKLFGVGIPLVRGRWFTLMPFSVPITIVVGKPIDVDRVEAPTDQQINDLHARYIESLKELYETHREACGHKDIELVIR